MRITENFGSREIGREAEKLRLLADDVGLTGREVEAMLGINADRWPLQRIGAMGFQQMQRLGYLLEIIGRVIELFGGDARNWFRQRNHALGVRPIDFLTSDPLALRALRDALRAEMGTD